MTKKFYKNFVDINVLLIP